MTKEWLRVARKILADRPDVVIFSEVAFPHLAFAPWMMRRAGITTAQICHEFTERDSKNRLIARLSLKASVFLFRQFHHIFFLSDATRRTFLANVPFEEKRTSRIVHGSADVFGPSCIDALTLRRELGISASEPVLLYFGYIRPSKGLDDLVEAYGRSDAHKHSRLVIAGHVTKYGDIGALKRRVQELGLQERVIFKTDYIPNDRVAAYFDMCRAVVLPYRSASQSGVLHLAYGQSRPVIATAVGGLSEDVVDGQTGLLVPPRSTIDLAKAIDRVVDDEHFALKMGTQAKALADSKYTWIAAAEAISYRLRLLNTDRKAGAS